MEEDVLGNADAAVHQLRELSDALEQRLKQRSVQQAVDLLPAAPRPSAFTTAEDHALLERPLPPPMPFPSAVDRQPGHTIHSFSPSRGRSPVRGRPAAGPPLMDEASSSTSGSPVRRSTGPLGASLSTGLGGAGGLGGTAGRGSGAAPAATHGMTEGQVLSREIDAAAASPALSYLVRAAATAAAYSRADAEGSTSPARGRADTGAGAGAGAGLGSGYRGQMQPGYRGRMGSSGAVGTAALSAAGTLPLPPAPAVPGQRQYRQTLAAVQACRTTDVSAFRREMAALDDEIDSYVSNYKYELNVPDAALALQAAWRARGPRLFLSRFRAIRQAALRRHARVFMLLLAQLARASLHGRRRLMRRCFHEWRELILLKLELYRKVILRLKASMIDVRDSQSPNHLWHLCTAPGEDPWKARLNLGRLVANILLNQAPRRKTKFYFDAWLTTIRKLAARRREAAAKLAAMEAARAKEQLLDAFRFWFRYAVIKVAARLAIEPPLFRPRMPEWDAWLWEHNRTRDLTARIAQLHRTFRLSYCFRWWHTFVARNKKLRKAWSGAAAKQIEALLRYSLNAMKANWRYASYRRKTRTVVLRAWLNLTRRNKEVRRISVRVQFISRRSILSLCMRRLRTYTRMGHLLAAGAAVRMWQRRTLALAMMYAWTGDTVHMWFAMAFYHWRAAAVGRLRFKCLLAAHMQRIESGLPLELAFKAWRKVAALRAQARISAVQAARKQLHAEWEQQDARLALLVASQIGTTTFKLDATARIADLVSESSYGSLPSDATAAQPARPALDWSNTLRPVRQGGAGPVAFSQLAPIPQDSGVSQEEDGDGEEEEPQPGNAGSGRHAASRPESAATHGTRAASAALSAVGSQLTVVSGLDPARSRPLSHHSEAVLPRDEVEEAAVQAAIQAAEEAFDESDGVLVTAADFPMQSIWRPLVTRPAMMRANDLTSGGLTPHKLEQMLDQLGELEGLFNPRLHSRQLMLDVARRGELTPLHALWLSTDTATAHHWRESGVPDGLLWQRVVGLRATSPEPFPDHLSCWMLDEQALPLREEVAAIEAANRKARCAALRLSQPDGASAAPSPERSVLAAAAAAVAATVDLAGIEAEEGAVEEAAIVETPGAEGVSMKSQYESEDARRRRQEAAAKRTASLGLLMSGDQKVTMYLYKLAEAEQLLETCACTLLGVGDQLLPTVYSLLEERAEPGELQGDMLVSLLSSALSHDTTFLHANMTYCNNRDRVITMGLELHEKARALHMHRPEFTLLYHDQEAGGAGANKGRRKAAVDQPTVKIDFDNCDSSDSDIPSPRPKTPMQLLREEAEKAMAISTPTHDGRRAGQKAAAMVATLTGGMMSPLGNTATRGQLSCTTPSKSHLIKMEMMGNQMAAAAAALGSDSPTGSLKRGWLPKAATAHTIASKTRSTTPVPEVSMTSLDASRPSTVRRKSIMIDPAAFADDEPPRREASQVSASKVAFGRTKSSPGNWRPVGYQKPFSQAEDLSPTKASRLRARSVGRARSTDLGKDPGFDPPDDFATRLERVASVPTLLPAPVPRRLAGAGAQGSTPGTPSRQAAGASPAPPTPPAHGYLWFESAMRLIPSIADTPVPAATPTMMDIEHVSQRLLGESLPHFFGIPPLPAIVFTRWGEHLEPGELPVVRASPSSSDDPLSRELTPQGPQDEGSWEDMAVAAWNEEAAKAEAQQGATAGSLHETESLGHGSGRGADWAGSAERGAAAEVRSEEALEGEAGPRSQGPAPAAVEAGASAGPADAAEMGVLPHAPAASVAAAGMPAAGAEDSACTTSSSGNSDLTLGLQQAPSSATPPAVEEAGAGAASPGAGVDSPGNAGTTQGVPAPAVPPLNLTPEVLAAATKATAVSSSERRGVRIEAEEPDSHRSAHVTDALSEAGASARMMKSMESRIGEDRDAHAVGARAAATMVALMQREEVLAAQEEAERARLELRASRQATEDGGLLEEGAGSRGERSGSASSSGSGRSGAPGAASGSRRATGSAGGEAEGRQDDGEGGESDGGRSSRRPSEGSRRTTEMDREDSDASNAVQRRRAVVQRPVFVPTTRQIDVFLGGHLRGRRWGPEATKVDKDDAEQKLLPRILSTADAPLGVVSEQPEHVFDPGQVLHTDSMRERTLLDGFDLAEELERLKGTKEHVPGLAGELRALELELAVVLGRRRPRRRRGGKAGSVRSFGNLETATIQSTSSYQDDYGDTLSRVHSAEFSRVGTPLYEEDGQDGGRSTTAPSGPYETAASPRRGFGAEGRVPSASHGEALSPSRVLALAGEDDAFHGGHGASPLSPWGQHGTDGTVVAHGESVRLSVRLRDYKPLGHASMMPPSSRRPFAMPQSGLELMSELEAASPPAGPNAAAMIDPATVFPDRPQTVDSTMGGVYPDSMASSTAAATTLLTLGEAARRRAHRVSGGSSGVSGADGSEGASADGPADFLFLTGLSHASARGQRRRTNLRTGGQALQPLSAEAFAGRPSATPASEAASAAAPPSGTPPSPLPQPGTVAGSRPASTSRSRPPSGSTLRPPPPPSTPPPVLPPVPAELANLEEDAVAELRALEEMWSARLYTGDVTHPRDQGPEPAELVQQMISQADEESWRQYEEGASRFVEELSSILAKEDQQQPDEAGRAGAGAHAAAALQGEDPRAHRSHQLMKALAVMEDHVAASLDPEKLTGLHLNSYPAQLSSLLSQLIVAPLATKFLFWKKVQSLAALKQRIMEDKALQQQLKDVAWAEGFDVPLPSKPAGPTRVPPGLPRGGRSGGSWFLGPGGLAASAGLEAHRAPWAPAGSLPPTGISQPLRSSRIDLKPRDDTPAGAYNFVSSQGNIGNFFRRERPSDVPPGIPVGSSHQHLPPHPTAGQQAPEGQQQQQQQQAMLLMSAEDVQQLAAPPVRDQLLRQQHELLHKRRQLQAALTAAMEAGPEAMLYAPTLDEEAEIVEKLAQVTVALHRDTLKQARRAAGLPDQSSNSGGTAAFGRGTVVPHWLRDREGGREGFQASPDPWFHAPRRATAAANAAAPPPVVSLHGAARPHAIAATVPELATLASGISGGKVASAALKPGAALGVEPGGGSYTRINSANPQGQGRPLRGPGAVPSPLAPIANPPVFPAAAVQPGNVQLVPSRPSAYVDRSIPPHLRPNVLSGAAAPLSARSPARKGAASPMRRSMHETAADRALLQGPEAQLEQDVSVPGPWDAQRDAHSPMQDPLARWDQGDMAGVSSSKAEGAGSSAPLPVGRPLASSPLEAWDDGDDEDA